LRAAQLGDEAAVNQVFSVMYSDLHRLARARLRRNQPITLLDTTSLVHESYLRLLNAGQIGASDRPGFLAYAARVMRSIIVDAVRKRQAARRGGNFAQVELDSAIESSARVPDEEIVSVDEALSDLAKLDGRLAQVVEMRYFAGLTEAEIAQVLG